MSLGLKFIGLLVQNIVSKETNQISRARDISRLWAGFFRPEENKQTKPQHRQLDGLRVRVALGDDRALNKPKTPYFSKHATACQ